MDSRLRQALGGINAAVVRIETMPRALLDNTYISKLQKQANLLERKYGVAGRPRPMLDLNVLAQKALRIYSRSEERFTNSEISNLPFILYDKQINEFAFIFLLNHYVDTAREVRLRRLLFVYFDHYNNDNRTKQIAIKLWERFKNTNAGSFKSPFLKKMQAYGKELFNSNNKQQLNELYKTYGVNGTIQKIGLEGVLATSKFILATLRNCFLSEGVAETKYNIFNELSKTDFRGYRALLPVMVDRLIILTESLNNEDWKKFLLRFTYKLLGDPRIYVNQAKWNGSDGVSKEAQEIFLRWLVNNDLTLFFEIIDKTAVDHMWRYRNRFWRAYLKHIKNTKVFLGDYAKSVARDVAKGELLNYGTVGTGCEYNHSAFLFEIGDYIFCEWSHNGRLYIWRRDKAPVDFWTNQVNKSIMTRSSYVEAITHSHSDKYNWQEKVSQWIYTNCGIRKTRFDWR